MTTTSTNEPVFSPAERISYSDKSIVSQHIVKSKTGNITLFAFDEGEQLSEHSAPFDAVVHVVDGTAEIHLDGKPHQVKTGEMLIMPANIPHAVYAKSRFKMMLTMIRS